MVAGAGFAGLGLLCARWFGWRDGAGGLVLVAAGALPGMGDAVDTEGGSFAGSAFMMLTGGIEDADGKLTPGRVDATGAFCGGAAATGGAAIFGF